MEEFMEEFNKSFASTTTTVELGSMANGCPFRNGLQQPPLPPSPPAMPPAMPQPPPPSEQMQEMELSSSSSKETTSSPKMVKNIKLVSPNKLSARIKLSPYSETNAKDLSQESIIKSNSDVPRSEEVLSNLDSGTNATISSNNGDLLIEEAKLPLDNINDENEEDFCNDNARMENMHSFHVLDEVENESDNGDIDSSDMDVPDDEIEQMLEDALSKKRKAKEAGLVDDTPAPYNEKEKIVLIDKGNNHFDILPEGWVRVTHNSGMYIYLHQQSRVCTLSKPYFLGPGSARKHDIPISAIPCLNYKRALEDEQAKKKDKLSQELPNAKIETVSENNKSNNLNPEQVRNYCEKLFLFRTIKVTRFKSWSERRQFSKKRKQEKQLQRPTLPDGTKLITFPIQDNEGEPGATKKEWIMNPNGKSYVCILHEYVQHALKKQPTYKFNELENAAMPYAAIVSINDMKYGVGHGTSKKQAKSEAAKATLEILIPEMRLKILTDAKTGGASTSKSQDQDLSFFDEIRIEDPRVAEFCAKTTEPSPHDILLTCLQRNFGLGNIEINYQGQTLKHQKNEFTMTVGKHTATVICKNKRDGKQRASQSILQALHPHINNWGSILRLYGNRSIKTFKEKKLEEQEITLLQSKAAVNSPNFAILNKLKLELGKLKVKRDAIKPIGVFVPPENEQIPNFSSSNLKNVDL